jgi:hypothetical protein
MGLLYLYSFLLEAEGHSAAGRIMSMINSSDTIGNRTRDVPTCNAVPQSTASPRAVKVYSDVSVALIPCSKGLF